MSTKFQKISTGFTFLDNKWGGVYPGGNYLIYGASKSGKTILTLKIIEFLVQKNISVNLLTSERPKNLEIQASSIYFDLSESFKNGILKIDEINYSNNNQEFLENYLSENNPTFLIIDKISDFQKNLNSTNYINFIKKLEENNITTILLSSIPSTDDEKKFLKLVAHNSTGLVHLKKNQNYSGIIEITPNVGHYEGEFETSYKVEPIKGFVTLNDTESIIKQMLEGKDSLFQSARPKQNFDYSNIYSIEEFNILLDSKLAMKELTGEQVGLMKYQPNIEDIKTVEICNVLKNAVDKEDKICFTDNNVYLLLNKTDTENWKTLINKIDEELEKTFAKDIDLVKVISKNKIELKQNFVIQ